MRNERTDNLRFLTEEARAMMDGHAATSFDGGGGGGYDGLMLERVEKLEKLVEKTVERVVNIERDVAVIRSNYATGRDVSDAKNSIVMWVVGAIFIAQLLPMLKDYVKPAAATTTPAASISAPLATSPQVLTPVQPASK